MISPALSPGPYLGQGDNGKKEGEGTVFLLRHILKLHCYINWNLVTREPGPGESQGLC